MHTYSLKDRYTIIERLRLPLLSGKSYHSPLPKELSPWYAYTADGGHSILCVLTQEAAKVSDPVDAMVPVPVKALLKAGYQIKDGLIYVSLPYDQTLGLITAPEDDEY